MDATVDVVLPAHNEGDSIERTLQEFYQVVTRHGGVPIRFVISEDGSRDNTLEVIQRVAQTLPLQLVTFPQRKGYSRAVIDGFRATQSELIAFIDSDGQCDPADFHVLHREMMTSDCDLVVGFRNPRRDHWLRLLMSVAFNQVYKLYFKVDLRDPSCPYLLIKREALLRVLEGNVGILKEGFWWEFFARARARHLSIRQVPVRHRARTAGVTVVYRPLKVPGIAWSHLRGLARLKRELRGDSTARSVSPGLRQARGAK
jgi:glycosyltransferase involved in cell wall biosynthesis